MPLGSFPSQVIYEVAFQSGVSDVTPVWTDVSRYVEGAEWEYGRPNDLAKVAPGTARLTLNNRDGRFSPWNTSSPYWNAGTGLVPMKPLRIRSVSGGTTYNEFRGFVLAWPAKRLGVTDSVVEVPAADAFYLFNKIVLPSVWEAEVRADAPRAWYRLGESSGTVAADSSGNGRHGTYNGGATFNSRASLIAKDSDTAISFAASGLVNASVPPAAAFTNYPFTVEAWVQLTEAATSSRMVFLADGSNGYVRITIKSDSAGVGFAGKLVFEVSNIAGTSYAESDSSVALNDGAIHHIACVGVLATDYLKVYVDGVDVTTTKGSAGSPWLVPTITRVLLGGPSITDGTSILGLGGTLDEVAIYGSALTAARIAAHYQAGTTPYAGDTTGTRVGRLLDLAGWPAGLRAVDAGQSTTTTANIQSKTLLAALQDMETAEDGVLFVAPNGNVTFYDRHRPLKAPQSTSQATFGDGGGAEIPYNTGLEVTEDVADIFNDVPASRTGGSVITVGDTASQNAYGKQSLTGQTGLLVTTDGEIVDRANWKLAHFKNPISRVRRMPLSSTVAAALVQQVSRQLRDRVTVVEHGPGSSAATFSQDFLIEHIRKRVAAGVYETEWALSATDAASGGYMVLDTGLLDSARLGY